MSSKNVNRMPFLAATITASILTLIFGLSYRTLLTRLGATVTSSPISPSALQAFPMHIGDWTGEDIPIDEKIVSRTGTDAHINRRYSRNNGMDSVLLYVACGTNLGNVLEHHPLRCYSGAGCTVQDRRSTEFVLDNGIKLPCNIFHFSRGDFETQRITVLHYIILDGQRCSEISVLRSRIWRILATVDYVAQVQIVVSSGGTITSDSMIKMASEFAVESASSIADIFERIQNDRNAETTDPLKKEGGSQ